MSWHETIEPTCKDAGGAIELVIEPQQKDLGGFGVRRLLPSAKRQAVGPFVFLDHFGPATFPEGRGIDVRPHPHIGLATVTYLFAGELVHRDSLGHVQAIQPGAVNLMTAGRGIVHSERSGADRAVTSTLHGLQSWLALPAENEEMPPAFMHYPETSLPVLHLNGATVKVIIGTAYGKTSPVTAYSPLCYLEIRLPQGRDVTLPDNCPESAVYVVSGAVGIDGCTFGDGLMTVARAERAVRLRAVSDSHVMVIGGEPLGERHLWWNFVSSSKQRIEAAKEDWREGRFGSIPGETEFIPLPE